MMFGMISIWRLNMALKVHVTAYLLHLSYTVQV